VGTLKGDTMENESLISPWHNRVVMVAGGASTFLGALVLTGWHTHNTMLIQVLPAFVPMQYNTALGFLLCGVGLLSVVVGRPRLAAACSAAAGTIGLLTLIEYIFGLDLGIDQFLMKSYITVETSHPGRMAPNTALCFSLIAAALLVREWLAPFRRRPLLLGGLGTLTLVLGMAAFISYLTGASTAYGWGRLTRMAVHTAAGFMALGTGVLMVAYRERALARSESVDIATRPRMRVFVVSTTIMAVATFAVALNVVRELHHTAVEQKKADLLTLVTSWAETIAASGGLDTTGGQQDDSGSAEAATLRQATAVYEKLSRLSRGSEFVLARRDGDQIVFLLSQQRKLDRERPPQAVPFDSDRAEPMRRALLGQSGTLIGLDYEGEVVLAAYTPFGQYGWGLVGKIDLAEVEAPFIRASLLACGVGLAIVVLGALAFLLAVDPMIRGLEERTAELRREIAERKQAEEARQENEEKYRGLFENESDAIMVFDAETLRIEDANRAASQLYGYSVEEFLGLTASDISAEPEKTESSIQKAIEGKTDLIPVCLHRKENGATFTVEIAAGTFVSGGRKKIIGAIRDITERRKAEEELKKHREHLEEMVRERTAELEKRISEVERLNKAMVNLVEDMKVINESLDTKTRHLEDANKDLESFSYSVSHDLRAPLRHIIGFVKILEKTSAESLDEKGRKYMEAITESTQRMDRLIDDLLSFARTGRTELQKRRCNIVKLVKETIDDLNEETEERDIVWEIGDLPEVHADLSMIKLVLANLLGNAVKYTRTREQAHVEIGMASDNEDELIIFVRDNGVGFDMRYVDKLFGVFQRLHGEDEYKGTGVGLANVHRIIHRHGGRTWAEGAVDEGATFFFSLPASQ